MAKKTEAPETLVGLLEHPDILRVARRSDLANGPLEIATRRFIVLGGMPTPDEFWQPDAGKPEGVTLTTLTQGENGSLKALTLTELRRLIVITPSSAIERLAVRGRDMYDPHTNVVSEWDETGALQRVEIVHQLPAVNGGEVTVASLSYWTNFEPGDPVLAAARTTFSPARSTPTIAINGSINSHPQELRPGFNFTGKPDQLMVKVGISTNVRWQLDIGKMVGDVWEISGLQSHSRRGR